MMGDLRARAADVISLAPRHVEERVPRRSVRIAQHRNAARRKQNAECLQQGTEVPSLVEDVCAKKNVKPPPEIWLTPVEVEDLDLPPGDVDERVVPREEEGIVLIIRENDGSACPRGGYSCKAQPAPQLKNLLQGGPTTPRAPTSMGAAHPR